MRRKRRSRRSTRAAKTPKKHPEGYKQVEISVRASVRRIENVLVELSADDQAAFLAVKSRLDAVEHKVLRELFPHRPQDRGPADSRRGRTARIKEIGEIPYAPDSIFAWLLAAVLTSSATFSAPRAAAQQEKKDYLTATEAGQDSAMPCCLRIASGCL